MTLPITSTDIYNVETKAVSDLDEYFGTLGALLSIVQGLVSYYGENSIVSIDVGDHYMNTRIATPEAIAKFLEWKKENEARKAQSVRENELATLARLKAKYGQ
jgi:uncharacterized membrane protein